MKVRLARDAAVGALRKDIRQNIEKYRTGDFEFLELDTAQYLELPVELKDEALARLKMPKGDDLFEVENCIALHDCLEDLTPYDARDERLWVYLCHTALLGYVRQRWPIPQDDEKAIAHIETHFFARTNRQVERDNAASRLWWMAHLCTRVEGVAREDALSAFLKRSDVRANIVERPTVAQSKNVFSVIVKALIKSAGGKQVLFERTTFRKIMVELNSIGGFKLLDALPESELTKIFDDVVGTRVGIAVV